ncbi:MAG: hypothetical protein AAF211_26935, partial [Myxococcota bacterium]
IFEEECVVREVDTWINYTAMVPAGQPFQCRMVSRIVKDYPFELTITLEKGTFLGAAANTSHVSALDEICGLGDVDYPDTSNRGLEAVDDWVFFGPNWLEDDYVLLHYDQQSALELDQLRIVTTCDP